MNILLIGGTSSFMNNTITKFKKEGHKVYLLSGNRYGKEYYQKVFERYDFPYDCPNLDDIYESVHPDVVIYTGIYDTNYRWHNEEKDSVSFLNGLNSLLMGFRSQSHGKFIYISSEAVYSSNFENDIKEGTEYVTSGAKSLTAAQAENLVRSYDALSGVDTVILRLGNLFSIPESTSDCTDICSKLTYQAVQRHHIMVSDHSFAPLFETDAISRVYALATAGTHEYNEYNISGNTLITEQEIADLVLSTTGEKADIINQEGNTVRCKLDSERFEKEFGNNFYCELTAVLQRVIEQVRRNKFEYREDDGKSKEKEKRKNGMSAAARAIVPFLENIIGFGIVMIIAIATKDISFVQRIDLFLIYTLIFAMVYGQNQAILSGLLSMVGFYFIQASDRGGATVVMDASTYIWTAQIFILGLSVGFMHDRIDKLRKEHEAESVFYNMQLADMKDINTSNVRVKDALETQIVNQSDSVGKIYSITSALDQYSPEEVLFYAADMISRITKSRDVAIYTVSNSDYARLFSFTSKKAQMLGNSIKYSDMGEMTQTLNDKKVFINRKLDDRYPLMASAVYDDTGRMQLIIMIWSVPWENMTLGQANQLVVIGALIQNAVIRATRYLEALEEKRYIKDTRALEPSAFTALRDAYLDAGAKGLTECLLLKCTNVDDSTKAYVERVSKLLRNTDYIGVLEDGVYLLLPNTESSDLSIVTNRLKANNVECVPVEE